VAIGPGDPERMKLFVLRLPLLLVSLGLVIGMFEIGLRLAGYEPIYEVYSKPSMMWQHDELLGWSHAPGSRGEYVGPRPWPIEYETPVDINSLGLRGAEIEPVPSGGLRILASGDSRMVALEVPYDRTFAAILGERLTKELGVPVQIVNAGVRGYGTDQSYLYYKERGRALQPDLVLFLHSNNDVTNNVSVHRMRRPFGKAVFRLDKVGELELMGAPVPEFSICSSIMIGPDFEIQRKDSTTQRLMCTLQLWLFDRSATFTMVTGRIQQNPDLLKRLYGAGAPKENPEAAMAEVKERSFGQELTAALLTRYARDARRDGADFMILGLKSALGDMADAAAEREGARVAYIDDAIKGVDPMSVRFVNDAHWNELGHERIASLLVEPVAEVLRARMAREAETATPDR
jgi:hypothetical protein